MTINATHRHPKYGDGHISGWYDNGMVMFVHSHGKSMIREEALSTATPLLITHSAPSEPPELPPIGAPADPPPPKGTSQKKKSPKKPAVEPVEQQLPAPTKLNLNRVSTSGEIANAFPQMGRVGAKKLFEKRPVNGWMSLGSVREIAGELFPSEESWQAFVAIAEV